MYNFVRAGEGAGVLKSLICTIYRSKTETCFVVCCQFSRGWGRGVAGFEWGEGEG